MSSVATKIKKNIVSNFIYQMLTLCIGIIIPRLVLVNLGSEANGLINSTNQVLVYLALFEGGMGLSITQALYGPVADNDHKTINGIMSASNLFYKRVGTYYLLGMMVVAVIYSFTITSEFSPIIIFTVVLLTGLPQVVNFYFQGKYRTLISISGKGYVLTNMSTVIYICSSFTKIALLLLGYGVVAIQLMYFVLSLAQMIYIIWFVKKEFPWLDISVKPLTERIGQRKSVFLHQLSGFVFSNTDMIVLTYFCDLKVVSVYSMYTMFFSMVGTLVSNITGGIVFAMGQTFNINREEYMKYHSIVETLNMILIFSCYSVLCVCILPFLKLYTAGIKDIDYIYVTLPYYFAAIQLLQAGRFTSLKAIEFAGEFMRTQWHAAIEVILNLSISIICSIKFGLYGVLLGTIVSLTVRSILMIRFACQEVLHINTLIVYKKWGINIVLFCVLQFLCNMVKFPLTNYLFIIMYAGGLMIICLLLYFIVALIYDQSTVVILFHMIYSKIIGRS